MVSTVASSRKIDSVPLPGWPSQSRIAPRCAPRASCAQRAATAVALSRQKPIGRAASAWCPGGRAITNALRRSPETTAATACSNPPTAPPPRLQQPPDRQQRGGAGAGPDPRLVVELDGVLRLVQHALDVAGVV